MGYESRIYVVNKRKYSIVIDGRQWGEVVAVYNACCFPGLSGVFFTEIGLLYYRG